MSNVKQLPGAPTLDSQPVAEVVDLLEELLADAKAGNIRAVALAYIAPNGWVTTNWRHEKHLFALMGGVSRLLARMNSDD